MSVKKLKLEGGLSSMIVEDVPGPRNIAITITSGVPAMSGLMFLDRNQQHLLMLYLQERLQR